MAFLHVVYVVVSSVISDEVEKRSDKVEESSAKVEKCSTKVENSSDEVDPQMLARLSSILHTPLEGYYRYAMSALQLSVAKKGGIPEVRASDGQEHMLNICYMKRSPVYAKRCPIAMIHKQNVRINLWASALSEKFLTLSERLYLV
jgi:hypothetical protein